MGQACQTFQTRPTSFAHGCLHLDVFRKDAQEMTKSRTKDPVTHDSSSDSPQVRGVKEKSPPRDRTFFSPVSVLSDKKEVHLAVEQIVQWACEVVRWQELAGSGMGDLPTLPTNDSRDFTPVSAATRPAPEAPEAPEDQADAQREAAVAALREETTAARKNAHTAFVQIVEVFQQAMQARWSSGLTNNIQAMALQDEQPATASIIRHALERACTSPRIDLDVANLPNWIDALGPAAHGRFDPRRPMRAQIALFSVAIAEAENEESNFDTPTHARQASGAFTREIEARLQAAGGVSGSQGPFIDMDVNECLEHPESLMDMAKAALKLSNLDRKHFRAGLTIPHFFSHEELSTFSLQSMHDVPGRAIKFLASGTKLEELNTQYSKMFFTGAGGSTLSDFELLGKARVHYLMTIVFTQDPTYVDPSEVRDLWSSDLDAKAQLRLDSKMKGAMDGTVGVAVANLGRMFPTLRDGVRRQRAQILIEQLASIMMMGEVDPNDINGCYYKITERVLSSDGNPQAYIVLVYDGWFNQIGDVSWPLIRFDSPGIQQAHLAMILEEFGLRCKDEVFVVDADGSL